VITFRNWRAIIFASLTGGVTYVMELIGLSGSTGQGDSSEPISKITL
jgi:hypothetical protein